MKPRPKSGTLRREDVAMIAGQHMPRRPSTGASSQSRNIMSLRDLGRIKQRASEVDVRPINYAIERKKRLKALSKEKTARFPDTLEAMRDRKQNFIKMKKEAEEEARREIDREEARFQREQRNNIIKKAEEAFFNQTDRMKLLLSRQAIAETIHERKKQIEERKLREQAEREEAAKYHVYTMEKVARGIEEEAAKDAKKAALVVEIAKARKEQLDDVMAQREAEAAEARAIGEAMKARAKEMELEDVEKAKAKERRVEEMNEQMMVANEKQIAIKNHLAETAAKEADKLAAEVEKIEFRKQAQKDVAQRMRDEKQKQRDAMIKRAIELLSKQKNKEDTALNNQIAEKRAADDAAIAEKKRKKEKLLAEIASSRQGQIDVRFQQYLKDKEEEKEMLVTAKEKWATALEEENEKNRRHREANDRIKMMQKEEGQRNARQKVQDRIDQIARDKLLMGNFGQEDERFKQVLVGQIESNVEKGMIVTPLVPLLEMDPVRMLPARRNPDARRKPGDPR